MKKLITGNEGIAYGALAAGVKVVVGYPGTPSTGAIASLLTMNLPQTHVEWSTNEKVAIDIAAGVAWAGHRVLCTMKMSGINVAYDSLISIAYSGCDGGMVIYVADDPGTSAGMCEQDSRGFALMSDMPMLEPTTVAETIEITRYAFELSESIKGPVFVRLTSAVADSSAAVEIGDPAPVSQADALLIHDISRYTKAGAVISTTQHRDLIARLAKAGELIEETDLNTLKLSRNKGGLGIIASGITASYIPEGFQIAAEFGFEKDSVSLIELKAPIPFPAKAIKKLMEHSSSILVLEELEPYVEKDLYVLAQQSGYHGKILGKLDGTFSRIGEYGLRHVLIGLTKALGLKIPLELYKSDTTAESLAAARPITVCAGCPHRGTYMAINSAIRKLHLKQKDVMVTGDIGCTILGINPPFNTIWNEISMGASVSLAQGFVYAGIKTPVLATIGDSTFFHGGIPGLINAVQHQVNITLIIMDNRWTAMTGMQINPGTPGELHTKGYREVDIAKIVPALGVDQFFEINPFESENATETIRNAMTLPGVKVILARQECAIMSVRQTGKNDSKIVKVVDDNCNQCKLCIMITGCAALALGEGTVTIDPSLCTQCGLCIDVCNREALVWEEVVQ
ncbi:MAG: thiamine pyrophosphate-dependent enzyme [Leptolinea sp.]